MQLLDSWRNDVVRNGDIVYTATDGTKYEPLGEMDAAFLSSETAGGFTGVYLALYAQGRQNGGCADFDWFEYSKTK